jgi:hypothetical protein
MQITKIRVQVNRNYEDQILTSCRDNDRAMLIAAEALATESAFADKKRKSYEKSQATYQANDCGNGNSPIDIFCQNLDSQIQDDGNAVAIILSQR